MTNVTDLVLIGRNAIVREGLRRILEDSEFRIIQSVSTRTNLSSWHEENGGTGLLMLIDNCNDEYGSEAIEDLQRGFPNAWIVLLTDSFEFGTMVTAFRSGVQGYIVKEISCERLIGSLQLAALGEKVFPSQLAEELALHVPDYLRRDLVKTVTSAGLSDRELEVLCCLTMGYPNKVISRRLSISEATVKVHVKAVLRKLEVNNRTQAAIWAANNGVRALGIEEDTTPTIANEPAALVAAKASLHSPQMLSVS